MAAWLWLSIASAGPLSTTSDAWELSDGAWWIDAPVEVEAESGTLRLERGYVFRVEDGEGAVGAAFVAEGTWTVRFANAVQARVFANRRVLDEGDPVEALRPVLEQESWSTTVDRAVLFGLDIWPIVEPSVLEVRREGGGLVVQEPGRIDEVIVPANVGLAAARNQAETMLDERLRDLRDYAFDPAAWVALDRMEGCRIAAEGRACDRIAELHTGASWERYAGADFVGANGAWLTWLTDPRGLIDVRYSEQVVARALGSDGRPRRRRVTTVEFPPDALGMPRAPHRVDLHAAKATHQLWLEGAVRIDQAVHAELQVRAIGGPASGVAIDVPHVHQQPFMRMHELPNGFELLGVETVDGEPLRYEHLPLTPDQREGRGAVRTLWVHLPRQLQPDEFATIRVRYRDHHRYAHFYETERVKQFQIYSMGDGMAAPAIPTVRSHNGTPVPTVLAVGRPIGESRRHTLMLPGTEVRSWEHGGFDWTEARTMYGDNARIALARARPRSTPPAQGFPTITAALQPGHADMVASTGSLVRQAVVLHRATLHDIALPHLGVMELGVSEDGVRVHTSDGLLAYRPSFYEARGGPRSAFATLGLVMAVHEQWWLPTGSADPTPRWHVSASFAAILLELAGDDRSDADLRAHTQDLVDAGRFDALSERAPVLIGAFVLGRTLRAQIGDGAWFDAVDRTLLGQVAPSWDGLQQALEFTSGRDLDDFFAVWVHGGHAPSVDLTWEARGDELHAALRTDLPFGRFTVPVQVGEERYTVELVDGVGSLVASLPEGSTRTVAPVVDPDGVLLLSSARVRRGALPGHR